MPMPDYSINHLWVVAATYDVDEKQARRAVLRHSIRVPKDERLDCLDVYCRQCRRTWEDVADTLCEAAEGNEHLRGGPIGTRRKRNHGAHRCDLLGCDVDSEQEAV